MKTKRFSLTKWMIVFDVRFQSRRLLVLKSACRAHVWTLPRMRSDVGHLQFEKVISRTEKINWFESMNNFKYQIAFLRESSRAVCARIRLLPGVDAAMVFQRSQGGETQRAQVTRIWSFAGMNPFVFNLRKHKYTRKISINLRSRI